MKPDQNTVRIIQLIEAELCDMHDRVSQLEKLLESANNKLAKQREEIDQITNLQWRKTYIN
jgi:hypothetical protein